MFHVVRSSRSVVSYSDVDGPGEYPESHVLMLKDVIEISISPN